MSLCFTVFLARKCPYKCANKFPESDLKLLLNSDCSAFLLSAHSISVNPPATMVAETKGEIAHKTEILCRTEPAGMAAYH